MPIWKKCERKATDMEGVQKSIAAIFRGMLSERTEEVARSTTDDSLAALYAAIARGLDRARDDAVGLSVSRTTRHGGVVSWDVHFGVDYSMTIVDSTESYVHVDSMDIAMMIIRCWQSDWDEIE